MALTGLRGQGFSPVSPAPYQQMRDNREMQAQQVLARREGERSVKKKTTNAKRKQIVS